MLYVWKDRQNNVRWHSWPNPRVSVKVRSESLCISSRACSTLYRGFRDFHRHFKLKQPLEFDFGAKFAKRLMRNDLFLGQKFFKGQSVSFIYFESLFDWYNYFSLRKSTREI